MVRALERLSYFYFEESCGQCTPCAKAPAGLYRIIHRIEHAAGRPEDLELLNSVAGHIGGHTSVRWATRRDCRCRASSNISAKSSRTTSNTSVALV